MHLIINTWSMYPSNYLCVIILIETDLSKQINFLAT